MILLIFLYYFLIYFSNNVIYAFSMTGIVTLIPYIPLLLFLYILWKLRWESYPLLDRKIKRIMLNLCILLSASWLTSYTLRLSEFINGYLWYLNLLLFIALGYCTLSFKKIQTYFSHNKEEINQYLTHLDEREEDPFNKEINKKNRIYWLLFLLVVTWDETQNIYHYIVFAVAVLNGIATYSLKSQAHTEEQKKYIMYSLISSTIGLLFILLTKVFNVPILIVLVISLIKIPDYIYRSAINLKTYER